MIVRACLQLPKTPPSALPGISPSRGEIRQRRLLDPKRLSYSKPTALDVGETMPHRISPLEGEMPGRAEGGMAG
jgi:diaminohydroxyphosphoribosylaminopyrimidine deaminase/5-amino-6-(5-phosphoribosylamino)uracil reductase